MQTHGPHCVLPLSFVTLIPLSNGGIVWITNPSPETSAVPVCLNKHESDPTQEDFISGAGWERTQADLRCKKIKKKKLPPLASD